MTHVSGEFIKVVVSPNEFSGRKHTMTPKQALKKIQEVIPEVTIICRNTNVTLTNICYIGENSNIDWGGITEYREPEYREPTLADLVLGNPKKVEVYSPDYDEWYEDLLTGVQFIEDRIEWICGECPPRVRGKVRIAV